MGIHGNREEDEAIMGFLQVGVADRTVRRSVAEAWEGYRRVELSLSVLYQRQLHFGTRAGLSGPTTGPRRL